MQYVVHTQAVNCVGEGAFSSIASFLTLASTPSPPGHINIASMTHDSVSLEWSKVAGNGAAVMSYVVEMDDGSGSFTSVARVKEPIVMLTNLKSGSMYKVRVQAENSEGYSSWSPVVVINTHDAEAASQPQLKCKPGNNNLYFVWDSNGQEQGTEYVLEMTSSEDENQCWREVYRGENNECSIKNIKPESKNLARLKVVANTYHGPYSKVIEANALPANLSPPCNIQGLGLDDRFIVRWDAPKNKDVLSYVVQLRDSSESDVDFQEVHRNLAPECEVASFLEGGKYLVRVKAVYSNGSSEWISGMPFFRRSYERIHYLIEFF